MQRYKHEYIYINICGRGEESRITPSLLQVRAREMRQMGGFFFSWREGGAGFGAGVLIVVFLAE